VTLRKRSRARARRGFGESIVLPLALLCWVPASVAAAESSLQRAEAVESTLIDAAAAVQAAVVTLEIHGPSASMEGVPSGMERFFPMDGLGSGFIIDADGTLLTNHHVIDDAEKIDVVLHDGRQFKAKVVASDPASDVGVLRIIDPPADLPVVVLGDSDGLQVGQFAIALGAPLGYQRSVTFGHISALHRSAIGERAPGLMAPGFERLTLQDFIQVDTPINPGNSGGPLVDLRGRVIGVNAAIMAAPGGGLGFSVPINLAMSVARQLLTKGSVSRAWLGVRMSDNNPAQVEAFDLPTSQGALVVEVFEGSPAAEAKLRPDDLIVGVGARVVRSSRDLVSAVSTADTGEPLAISLFRKHRGTHRRQVVEVILRERPADLVVEGRPPQSSQRAEPKGTPLADEERSVASRSGKNMDRVYLLRGLGIELVAAAGTRRAPLAVSAVAHRSFAAEAGLREGDVILEVGGAQVATVSQLLGRLQSAERPFISVVIQRTGTKRYLSIEVPR
jgi:serine protease Do